MNCWCYSLSTIRCLLAGDRRLWTSLILAGVGGLLATIAPGRAAERIYVSYSLLERSIPVASLESYARTGAIDDDLAVYTQFADESTLKELRSVLLARVKLSAVTISQFLYSAQGELLLRRLGTVIKPEARDLSGYNAIRAALILAAADSEGLTLLNFLRKFPTRGLRIDVAESLRIARNLEKLISQTNRAVAAVNQEASVEQTLAALTLDLQEKLDFPATDLRQRGPFTFQKRTVPLTDLSRPAVIPLPVSEPQRSLTVNVVKGRVFPVDIYLPQPGRSRLPARLPVVIISHGLGSDRNTFAYLAEHLASYGFAVLVPEHPGSNLKQQEALVNGTASEVAQPTEFIDRPLDITYLLNYLEQQPAYRQLNLQQVGMIGQSFGGYTALVLAGAPLNFVQLQAACADTANNYNLSLLLQCQALLLADATSSLTRTLQDRRIQAVIALNPITSAVLGQDSLSQIQIPTMVVSGSADTVAPTLLEQIQPFTWLSGDHNYLVLMDGGTHFSVIAGTGQRRPLRAALESTERPVSLPAEVIGPNPAIARRYVNALSLAFFQTYIANQPSYAAYLQADYAAFLSEAPLQLSLVQTLTVDQLAQALNGESRSTPAPTPTPTSAPSPDQPAN